MKRDAVAATMSAKSKDWRRTILRHASSLFDKAGYTAATMDDLAELVGLAKPSLYYYFRSKDEILYELSHSAIVQLIEKLQSRSGIGLTSSQLILEAMVDVLEMAHDDPGRMRVLVEYTAELSEGGMAQITDLRAQYQRALEQIVGNAMASGDIRAADVEMATRALFGMTNWAYRWIRPQDDPRRIAYLFWDVVFNGLCPTPGAQEA